MCFFFQSALLKLKIIIKRLRAKQVKSLGWDVEREVGTVLNNPANSGCLQSPAVANMLQ